MTQKNFGEKQFSRLSKDIQPFHYEITLYPDLESFTYNGKQTIFINVIKSTKIINLNSININIKSVVYYNNENKNNLYFQSIKYNISEETVFITFEKELTLGKGYLHFEFSGIINEKLHGLYRSKYTSNGITKVAAVTQFAATDARRCFPCWDEPAIKATFEISLTTLDKFISISNTPIKSITKNQNTNLVTTNFEKTPLMSTYLVAFIICDYDFIEIHDNNKIIRVYAPKDKITQGEFSLNVAGRALNFFNCYFNIPYPLPKLDLVTVADFSFGAMENWGLITYREAILLVDSQSSSTKKKERAALTVAHEVAHQWFGNFVTMEWWTHLWLNEGYATFMEHLCIENLYPEYNIWTHFLTNIYIKALELDALSNTHPIEVPVENPSQITEIFDQISYNKGASIIRMIYNYIGDDDFRKGMNLYLNKYSYSNVQTEDLWNALEEASNKPIGKIMSNWIKISGFPLISVMEKHSSNLNERIFTFSQEKFLINGSIDRNNITWIIPITVSSALNPFQVLKVIILNQKSKDITIEGIPKTTWIKINTGSVGFFRTLYSSDLLKMLIGAIKNQSLPSSDRLGLLDDLFVTAQAGRSSTVEFLNLLKEFKDENDYTVWSCIINNLRKVNNILLSFKDVHNNFKTYGRNLLSNIFSKLGWIPKPNENHLETLLRHLVLSQLVDFQDASVITEAQYRFQLHITKQTIIPADFRDFVYRAVLSVADLDMYDKMLSLYRETDISEERNRILSSLGAIKDNSILPKLLKFCISEEVKAQDAIWLLQSVTNSYEGQIFAWKYFKDNWKIFVNRFQSGTLLTNIVEVITKNIITNEIVADIKEFFDKNPIVGTERRIQQSIENIEINLAWLNRDKNLIKEFLQSQ